MSSPCCNAPTYITPFFVGKDDPYMVEMCHSLDKYGIQKCKKPVAVYAKGGGRAGVKEASQVMIYASQGIFRADAIEGGGLISVRPSSDEIRAPRSFIEASAEKDG